MTRWGGGVYFAYGNRHFLQTVFLGHLIDIMSCASGIEEMYLAPEYQNENFWLARWSFIISVLNRGVGARTGGSKKYQLKMVAS